ncbi:MAG: YbjN domain-containing protein [Bifidobacteriaceae bacterium]|jgi:hypothetical protein|nr:YbjN domain-containing protein [Bifidobacteriaceae bacterium]
MDKIEAVRAKVEDYLAKAFSRVQVDEDGDYTIREGSARAFVRVVGQGHGPGQHQGPSQDHGQGPVYVSIFVPVLTKVTETPELHRWLAYQGTDVYSRYFLRQDGQGTVAVFLTHMLLGDHLDEAELAYAVSWILGTADKADDELQRRFGGVRFHED